MVAHPEPRDRARQADAERVVAAFDFDKTLSTRDNVVPFLVAVAGRRAFVIALARTVPAALRGGRNGVKERLARRLLAGRPQAEIRDAARRVADDVIAHHLRADVVARAGWHRRAGHDLVIVSASFTCYLEPIAEHLGFDAVLGTGLEVVSGELTGRLDRPNVRGAEKVRRLEEWLAGARARIWAYGDSSGDRALLARADVAERIGRVPIAEAPDADRPGILRSGIRPPDSASGTGRVAP